MFAENKKISLRQLQVLLILDIFGTAVVTLPRITAELGGQNGWQLIAGGTALVVLYTILIHRLCLEYPHMTFVEFSQEITNRPVGILLTLGLGFKILVTAGLDLRIFCEIIRQTMLMETPTFVTAGAMVLVAAYIAQKGYEVRARAGEILVIIMFLPFFLVFLIACIGADFSNLLPLQPVSPTGFIKGSVIVAFSFQGMEYLLFAHPFIRTPKKVGHAAVTAVLILGSMMILTTLVTFARFGIEDVQMKLWPVIQMMDTVDIPGSFIERQDVLVMWFWIISSFAGVSAGLYFVSILLGRLTKKKEKRNIFVYAAMAVVFLVSLLPSDVTQTYQMIDFCNQYFGFLYIFIIPIILYFIAKRKKKGGIRHEKAEN